MFGFDKHSEPVHLLPLQLIQLGSKIVMNKVQLFGKLSLLQAEKQHTTDKYTLCHQKAYKIMSRRFAEAP